MAASCPPPSLLNPQHAACITQAPFSAMESPMPSTAPPSINSQSSPLPQPFPESRNLEFCRLQPWLLTLLFTHTLPLQPLPACPALLSSPCHHPRANGKPLWPAEAPVPPRVHVKCHTVVGWETGPRSSLNPGMHHRPPCRTSPT